MGNYRTYFYYLRFSNGNIPYEITLGRKNCLNVKIKNMMLLTIYSKINDNKISVINKKIIIGEIIYKI